MDHIRQFLLDHHLIGKDALSKLEDRAHRENRLLSDLVAEDASVDPKALHRAFVKLFMKKPPFEILLEMKLITPDQLRTIEEEFGAPPADLGRILLERKILTEEQYAQAVARELSLEYVDLTNYKIDDSLFNSVDVALMRTYSFIPDSRTDKEFVLIMSDPGNVDAIEELEVKLGLPVLPKVASLHAIQKQLSLMIETSLDSKLVLADMDNIQPLELVVEKESAEEAAPGLAISEEVSQEAPVVKMVDSILLKAVRKKSSDIHFEVYESQLKVKFRIDGVLHEIFSDVEPRQRAPIISRLKVMAQLDIAEKRIPQDGRFKLKIDDRAVDFRVSVLPSIFGETVVLRILDKSSLGLDIQKVGLQGNDLLAFQRNVKKPYGMVLVAGPTGSGKTTTLYSAIKYVKTPEDKFITIEDPVEYQLPDIVQIPVNEKKGLTFGSGLRSIVRQDPDAIMVGEIRDQETAQIAVNAALTGHLVMSSIHANNVIDAISRLTNMGIDPYEFVSSFNLILSQRLIRRICPNCKTDDDTITEEMKRLNIDFEEHASAAFKKGAGCRYCHKTGYQGRFGIFEVLEMTPRIKQMILSKESPLLIRKAGIEQGMIPLRQAGWKRVEAGDTTFDEMNRVTFEEGNLA